MVPNPAGAVPYQERLPIGVCGVLGGLALGSALGVLPAQPAMIVVGVAIAFGLAAFQPIWALSVLLLTLPLEFVDLQIASVGISPMQIAAGMLVVLLTASLLARGRLDLPQTPLDVPALLWVAVLFLGAIEALDPGGAVKKAGMGILFVVIYYLVIRHVHGPRQVIRLLRFLVISTDLVALYGVVATYVYLTTGVIMEKAIYIRSEDIPLPRIASTVGNPSTLAGLIVLTLPIALALFLLAENRWDRLLFLASSLILLVSLGLTFSRGAWLGGAASFLVMAIDRRARRVVLAGGAILAMFAPAVFLQRIESVSQFDRPEIAARFYMWQSAVGMFEKRPFFGVGANNFPLWVGRLKDSVVFSEPPAHAHNAYLQLLSENGLAGAISFLGLLGAFVYQMLVGRNRSGLYSAQLLRLTLAAAFVGHLAQQFTDTMLTQNPVIAVSWVMFGLGIVLVRDWDGEPATGAEPVGEVSA